MSRIKNPNWTPYNDEPEYIDTTQLGMIALVFILAGFVIWLHHRWSDFKICWQDFRERMK